MTHDDHPAVHLDEYDHIPIVEQLEVTKVQFWRGNGCCEKSPVRVVTAYYDAAGHLLAEVDPMRGGTT